MATSSNDFRNLVREAAQAKELGDAEMAYSLYARASELEPNSPEGWLGRAATSPDRDDSLLSLAYSAALAPDDDAAHERLARAITARSSSAGADDASRLALLGKKIAEVGLTGPARSLLSRATELDREQEDAWIWLAAVTADSPEVKGSLERALAINGKNPIARAGLAAVSRRQGQRSPSAGATPPAEAATPRATVAASRKSIPDLTRDLMREAQAALDSGDRERAYKLFSVATDLSPNSEDAWLGKSQAGDELDDKLAALERASQINPQNPNTRDSLTYYRIRKLREEGQPVLAKAPPVTQAAPAATSRPPSRLFVLAVGFLVFLLVFFILMAIILLVRG